ncbi:hypothetical protein D4765_11675 [Subtercola vilae]|uniref:Uncharacterized protein n=1 Tax=Subtercola vilae TaxID=2056433 RepID=A0A4T2BZ77_9MICO|nr:hypothetical protein D4765_11675 [Subtercola vilae]
MDRSERESRSAWEDGKLIPDRITTYLDMAGLDGPGVDEACGVKEPAVDLWEAGELYPTWEQLLALANICSIGVKAFFWDDAPHEIPGYWRQHFNIKSDADWEAFNQPAIMRFTPAALADHRSRVESTPATPEETP